MDYRNFDSSNKTVRKCLEAFGEHPDVFWLSSNGVLINLDLLPLCIADIAQLENCNIILILDRNFKGRPFLSAKTY